MDPADWLTLIEERAPGLRAAGVQSLSLEGVSIQLAPRDTPIERDLPVGETSEPDESDPLNNPMLYPGGRIPGYQIDYDALRRGAMEDDQ